MEVLPFQASAGGKASYFGSRSCNSSIFIIGYFYAGPSDHLNLQS
jgi:hypothetical protein